uniref:Uncharacterized protein n=1 Tax=Cajanus cajan TaxID=3821 RepID=A0A151U5G8_CAJCA|nr:hypothetical protein KK1_007230 [Cajanus cajan]
MPYAMFLASHACTQNLMSKLLPRPTPQDPPLREEMCYKEEHALAGEAKRDIEMDGVQCMKNGENVALVGECGPREEDATDGIEGHPRGETNGVVTMIEGLDKIGNEIEEFETPFEITTVVLEESQDQDMEGDIEEAEVQRETKGLLEKIRDEGRTQERGEYVEGICGGENENDQKIGLVVEDMEVAWEDTDRGIIGETEKDPNICEEMVLSRNDESEDTICNEVESDEYVRGLLEGKEFDDTNDSQKSMAETFELLHGSCFTHETIPIGDLRIQALVYNVPVDDVVIEKTDIHFAEEEPEPPLDCPTQLQEGKLDNSISDTENQESQLHHEMNEMVYSADAEAREIANAGALDLFDGKQIDQNKSAFTIDLREG